MLQNPNWQTVDTTAPFVLVQEDGFDLLQEDGFLIYLDGVLSGWSNVSTNQNPIWQTVVTAQSPNWQVVT